MNKKAIVVICAAAGLVIPALSFMTNRAIIKMSAERTTYTMTLDEHNAPALTDSPSNGSFTVNTAGGNPIQFDYESFVAASGNLASMLPSGSLTNQTALTGVFSVSASYMGTMGLYYGLTRADVNSIALTSGTEVELPIQACFISFRPLTAVTITSIQIKYECSLSAEAEEQKAMEAKRYELLGALEFEREDYRSDELDALDAVAAPIINDIMNADTMSELEAISLAPFNTALANAKTNAELMIEEAYRYSYPSKWPLVNEHSRSYVEGQSAFKTNGNGFYDVGYITSPGVYSGGFEMVLSLNNTAAAAGDFGIVIGNDSTIGDGLDGYFIAMDYASDHMYLQVFKLVNAYSTYGGENVRDYIHGWIYNRGTGDLRVDDIRVIYNGTEIIFMNEDDYQNGLYDINITVDLNKNGYSLNPGAPYRFSYLNWDSAKSSANELEIKKLAMDDTVNSSSIANDIADVTVSKYDSTKYGSAEQAQFAAKIDEIDALRSTGSYASIIGKVNEFVGLQDTALRINGDSAITVLDNMFSFGDAAKSTPSNWDAVNNNVASWTHVAGTNTVVTSGLDGYCMDAAIHTSYTFVFKVTNVHATNPYAFSMPGAGFIIGGEVDNTTGDYFKGYYISLSRGFGFQVYDALAGAEPDSAACFPDKFLGGYDCLGEGLTFRVTITTGNLAIYLLDVSGVEVLVGNLAINVPAGHFGIFDWDVTPSTYKLLEFRDL